MASRVMMSDSEKRLLDLFVEIRTALGPVVNIKMGKYADRAISLLREEVTHSLRNMTCSYCRKSMQWETVIGCEKCKRERGVMRQVEEAAEAVSGNPNW